MTTLREQTLDAAPQGYEPLAEVLSDALAHASKGKGDERHANGKPFLQQPMLEIGRMVGPGFCFGQAMKKIQEAGGMLARGERDRAIAELWGAINYTAGSVLLIRERALAANLDRSPVDAPEPASATHAHLDEQTASGASPAAGNGVSDGRRHVSWLEGPCHCAWCTGRSRFPQDHIPEGAQ